MAEEYVPKEFKVVKLRDIIFQIVKPQRPYMGFQYLMGKAWHNFPYQKKHYVKRGRQEGTGNVQYTWTEKIAIRPSTEPRYVRAVIYEPSISEIRPVVLVAKEELIAANTRLAIGPSTTTVEED